MAPTLKKLLTKMSQNDLNLRGKTSDKLFVLIGITIPREIPIILLHISNAIQEGIVLKILNNEIINKQNIIIFFLVYLCVKNPDRRLPKAIKSINELDIRQPLNCDKL